MLPESAPGMVRPMASVEEASAVELLDATVRRTDYIDEAETGRIAVTAADVDLARTLGVKLRKGTFLTAATAATRRSCWGAWPRGGSASTGPA